MGTRRQTVRFGREPEKPILSAESQNRKRLGAAKSEESQNGIERHQGRKNSKTENSDSKKCQFITDTFTVAEHRSSVKRRY